MATRQLQRLALKVRHHYWVVFLAVVAVLSLALVSASRLQFDTDILNLLPRNAPEVQTLRQALDDFGSIDLLVIAIRVPEEANLGPYEELTDQLGRGLVERDTE